MENSLATKLVTAMARVPRSKESYFRNQSALETVWLNKTKSLPALFVMNRLLLEIKTDLRGAIEEETPSTLFSMDFYYVKNFIGLRYVVQDKTAVHFPDQTTNVIRFYPRRNHLRVVYSPTKATRPYLPLKCVMDYKVNAIGKLLGLEDDEDFYRFNMQEAIGKSFASPIVDYFETQEYKSLRDLIIENVVRQVVSNIGGK